MSREIARAERLSRMGVDLSVVAHTPESSRALRVLTRERENTADAELIRDAIIGEAARLIWARMDAHWRYYEWANKVRF